MIVTTMLNSSTAHQCRRKEWKQKKNEPEPGILRSR